MKININLDLNHNEYYTILQSLQKHYDIIQSGGNYTNDDQNKINMIAELLAKMKFEKDSS